MTMSSISIKIIQDGVERVVTPKSVVNNIMVTHKKAREYLLATGLYTDEQLATDDDVATAYIATYFSSKYMAETSSGHFYYSDLTNSPYPFGSKSVLHLGIGLYNDSSDVETLLPSNGIVSIGSGLLTSSDTGYKLTYTVSNVSSNFNRLMLHRHIITDFMDNTALLFHGSNTPLLNTVNSTRGGDMLFYIDGSYYQVSRLQDSKGGVYGISGGTYLGERTKFMYNSRSYGGIVDNKMFVCQGISASSTVLEGIEINHDIDTDTFSSSDKTITFSNSFEDANINVYAIYGYTDSWMLLLYKGRFASSNVGAKLVFVTAHGSYVVKQLDEYDDYVSFNYSLFTMIDGVLYLGLKSNSAGKRKFFIIKPNTGDFATATDIDIVDTRLYVASYETPCNDGNWYYADFSDIVRIVPDIPVLDIKLDSTVDVSNKTCSVELDISVTRKDGS